jgi:anti-sigma regulatory factor (Ser/Thr protein kinase)
LELRIPATAPAISGAREAFDDLGLPEPALEEARLLVSELVTNSIRHSGLRRHEQVRVRADWSGSRLHVDVFDRPASSSVVGHIAGTIRPPPDEGSGWGLFLVDRLADRWGSAPGRYWFELDVGSQRTD